MIVGLLLLEIEIKPQCDTQTETDGRTDRRTDSAVKTVANKSCVRRCCGFWL